MSSNAAIWERRKPKRRKRPRAARLERETLAAPAEAWLHRHRRRLGGGSVLVSFGCHETGGSGACGPPDVRLTGTLLIFHCRFSGSTRAHEDVEILECLK